MTDTSKSRSVTAKSSKQDGFTEAERAAIKERAQELRPSKRRGTRNRKEEDAQAVLAKIAEMPEPDRALAGRVHELITSSAPDLAPKLWYGSPAYAKDSKIICFYQSAEKFKTRYATLGFNEDADLDDGVMWPTSFALTGLTQDVEQRIRSLVQRAVG